MKYNFLSITKERNSDLLNFDNDFDINTPIEFSLNHKISEDEQQDYNSLIEYLGMYIPEKKLTLKKYNITKQRIKKDFTRALENLKKIDIQKNETLFVSIGNSMESYGYMLHIIFPEIKIKHIKVSRTLKDNVEKLVGEEQRKQIFQKYFYQKINTFLGDLQGIRNIVLIDTFGAGETTATIINPFIYKGLESYNIYIACLLEGGHTAPTPPYDQKVELVHLPEIEKLRQKMQDFISAKNNIGKMPVLTFNEYFKLSDVKYAIENYNNIQADEKTEILELIKNYKKKKLEIFLDVQKLKIFENQDFIVIPSQTTRVLAMINPYFLVTQKTVFIAENTQNYELITRDGHGISRQEEPSIKLHLLNNQNDFKKLSISEKIDLFFKKKTAIFEQLSEKTKSIVNQIDADELKLIRSNFDSFLRKKIIYNMISNFETI